MRSLKPLVIILLFFVFASVKGFGQCKKMAVDSNITHTSAGQNNGAIELDIKGNGGEQVSINLFGPRRNNRLDLEELTIKDLEKGNYIIVVSGRKEGSDLCPVAINVTIN